MQRVPKAALMILRVHVQAGCMHIHTPPLHYPVVSEFLGCNTITPTHLLMYVYPLFNYLFIFKAKVCHWTKYFRDLFACKKYDEPWSILSIPNYLMSLHRHCLIVTCSTLAKHVSICSLFTKCLMTCANTMRNFKVFRHKIYWSFFWKVFSDGI